MNKLGTAILSFCLTSSLLMGADANNNGALPDYDSSRSSSAATTVAFATAVEGDVEQVRAKQREARRQEQDRIRAMEAELARLTSHSQRLEDALIQAKAERGAAVQFAQAIASEREEFRRRLEEKTDTQSRLEANVAAARADSDVNQRLADSLRAETRENALTTGMLMEQLSRAQRQLYALVTSDNLAVSLTSTRGFILQGYAEQAASLSGDLTVARENLALARTEHTSLVARRGENQPTNLETLIEQVADRVTRLQETVRAKEQSLSSLTEAKTALERQIEEQPKKYVRSLMRSISEGALARMNAISQVFELARWGNNYGCNRTDGLAQGSDSIRLELIALAGGESQIRTLFATGRIAPAVIDLFLSLTFDGIVLAYTEGMEGAPEKEIRRRFSQVLRRSGIEG